MILVCRCDYEKDRKNQKILVGYGLSSRDRCVHSPEPLFLATPDSPNIMPENLYFIHSKIGSKIFEYPVYF